MSTGGDPPWSPAAPRGNLTAHAVERLRDVIVEGRLAPGSRIPEHVLCERFGLSRTPLREALKILAADGLVVLTPHRGAIVARPSLEEIEQTLQILIAFEGLAAGLACARITEYELAAIACLHARMVEHFEAGRLLDYFRANQAIHPAIVGASGNDRLARLYRAESTRIHHYRYAGNEDPERWRRAVLEHEQILEALRERDADLLRALMRAHLTAGWRVARARLAGRTGSEEHIVAREESG